MKLKRLLAPKFWRIARKHFTWAISPIPGPHRKFECIPLGVILRDILKLAETRKEAKKIVKRGEILVDQRVRKEIGFPVGVFDTISIPRIKKHYRVVPFSNGLKLVEIDENESKVKVCKIVNKSKVKKGKIQLHLNDGRNILLEENGFKTGDSLLIELPSQKILKHIKLEKGNLAMVVKGSNIGKIVRIKEIIPGKFKQPSKVICEHEGKTIEILKEHLVVIGEKEPLIKVIE